jgi:hypothetical protein
VEIAKVQEMIAANIEMLILNVEDFMTNPLNSNKT